MVVEMEKWRIRDILKVEGTKVAYSLVFGATKKFLPLAETWIMGSLLNTEITGRDKFVGSRS